MAAGKKIEEKVKEMGYPSVDHYFIANAGKTFNAMADELMLSITTITTAYKDLLDRAETVK